MSYTSIDIQNLALIYIGEQPIESIDDNTKPAQILKRIYNQTVESELRKYNWNFAMTRARIPALADDSYDDWDKLKQYQIPVDCLRIVYVENWYIGAYPITYNIIDDSPYRIEGDKILTAHGIKPLFIRYIKRVNDPYFDPNFVDVVAYALAVKLSAIITQTTTIKQQVMQQYQIAVEEALMANAIEAAPTTMLDNSFITSRL